MVHHQTDERRLVSRVLRHWREMATGRRFPSTVEIDPWIVGNDWEYCFVIRLRQEQQATFLMVGAALLPDAGTALEYKPIVMCPPNTVLATVLKHLPRCIADAAPLSIEGPTQHCGASVLFRAVLLPLADDGSHIDGMFGAVNYRAMKPGEEMAVRTRSEIRTLDVSVGQLWDVFDATVGWESMVVLSVEGDQVRLMSKQNYLRHVYSIQDMTMHSGKFRFAGVSGAHPNH